MNRAVRHTFVPSTQRTPTPPSFSSDTDGGWGRSAARQLYLWGFVGVMGAIVWLVYFGPVVIATVLPITPIGGWLIALYTPMGLLAGAAVTALHIGSRLRKEDYSR